MNEKEYWKTKRTLQEQGIMSKGICWDQGKKYTQLSKVPIEDLKKTLSSK